MGGMQKQYKPLIIEDLLQRDSILNWQTTRLCLTYRLSALLPLLAQMQPDFSNWPMK